MNTSVKTYKKKPLYVKAIQYDGTQENIRAIKMLNLKGKRDIEIKGEDLLIKTLEGDMLARKTNWIIQGIKGELYPCKDEIFKKSYEVVKDN